MGLLKKFFILSAKWGKNMRSKTLTPQPTKEHYKRFREYLNLSQEQAAALFNTTRNTWRGWETDKTYPTDKQGDYIMQQVAESKAPLFTPERLKALRSHLTMSQRELSLLVGIPRTTLAKMERGKKVIHKSIQEELALFNHFDERTPHHETEAINEAT